MNAKRQEVVEALRLLADDAKDLRAQGVERMWSSADSALDDGRALLRRDDVSGAAYAALRAARYIHGISSARYDVLFAALSVL